MKKGKNTNKQAADTNKKKIKKNSKSGASNIIFLVLKKKGYRSMNHFSLQIKLE
jgi:hypothetical protein